MKRYIRSATTSNVMLARTSTDLEELAQLANDENKWVRQFVAQNQNTSANALAQLATDEDWEVRYHVAGNPNTSADVLAQLANDKVYDVIRRVAKNSNTSADALAQLANDEDEVIRRCVAHNPSTPAKTLAQLANDADEDVRWWVTQNPNTPADVRAQLAHDEDADVEEQTASSSNTASTNDWQSFLNELGKECEEYSDPLYEQSPAGEQLLELCYEVEREMPFWLEPSVQAGQGGIWIYDNETDETLADNIDYEDFNYEVVDMAFESDSADDFKQRYKNYLTGLVD